MSDDRKDGSSAGEPEAKRDGEGDTAPPSLPPFVQNDDSASMRAHFPFRQRAAALDTNNQVFGPLPLRSGEANLSGETTLTVDASLLQDWDGDWTAMRAEIIGRLGAIEAGFQKIRPFLEAIDAGYRERSQIGHNNPPEPIDILLLDAGELEMGIAAANLARDELNAEHPRFDVIRLCGLVLQWIGAKAEMFLDALLKSAGTTAGVGAAAALVAVTTQLHVDLGEVASKLRHVFELLHLPF